MLVKYYLDVSVLSAKFDDSQKCMSMLWKHMHGLANRSDASFRGRFAIDLPEYRKGERRSLGRTMRFFAESISDLETLSDHLKIQGIGIAGPSLIPKDEVIGMRRLKKFNIPKQKSFAKQEPERAAEVKMKRMMEARNLPYFIIDRGRERGYDSEFISIETKDIDSGVSMEMRASPNTYGLAASRPDDPYSDFWVPAF